MDDALFLALGLLHAYMHEVVFTALGLLHAYMHACGSVYSSRLLYICIHALPVFLGSAMCV